MKNFILYLLFELFFLLIKILPDRACYYVGIGFGKLVFYLVKSRRKVTIDNLKKAYGNELSTDELMGIVRYFYHHLGLVLVEFILLDRLNQDEFMNNIVIENESFLRDAFKEGKGIIIYSAHFGNWEWMAAAISSLGYPLNAIVKKQKNNYFNQKINKIREDKGTKIISKGISVRKAYQALKRGESLFILGDQNARNHGWIVDFFGLASSTYPGVVQFAQRTGALIVPAFLVRERWGKHRLVFYKPYRINKNTSKKEQQELLQELVSLTEKVIRKYPEQWYWLHRRWKTNY